MERIFRRRKPEDLLEIISKLFPRCMGQGFMAYIINGEKQEKRLYKIVFCLVFYMFIGHPP
jgi:hypothetical protein